MKSISIKECASLANKNNNFLVVTHRVVAKNYLQNNKMPPSFGISFSLIIDHLCCVRFHLKIVKIVLLKNEWTCEGESWYRLRLKVNHLMSTYILQVANFLLHTLNSRALRWAFLRRIETWSAAKLLTFFEFSFYNYFAYQNARLPNWIYLFCIISGTLFVFFSPRFLENRISYCYIRKGSYFIK